MKTPAPRWVCLQLLQACNLRCSMCYEWGTIGIHKNAVRPKQLAFDVVARVIAELAPYRPHFDLFGGEPLYYPQIGEVVRRIKGAGSTLDLTTNGTRLVEYAEMIAEAEVDRIWVSLDGPPEINDRQRGAGTFADVVAGVSALAAARRGRGLDHPRIGLTFVVTPLNHEVIEETFLAAFDRSALDQISIEYQTYLRPDQLRSYEELLHGRFGVAEVRFARGMVAEPDQFASIDAGRVAAQIERVRAVYEAEGKTVLTRPRATTADNTRAHFGGRFEEMSDYHDRCYFPWLYAEVSAGGDVTPCHTFYDLTFGNVNQQPLLEIWRSEAFEDARRHWKEHLLPVCHACCLYHTDPIQIRRNRGSAEDGP